MKDKKLMIFAVLPPLFSLDTVCEVYDDTKEIKATAAELNLAPLKVKSYSY